MFKIPNSGDPTSLTVTRRNTRYPIQTWAILTVSGAVKRGDLVRPTHCDKCRRPRRVQAHHDDYLQPLKVRWLCPNCHKDWHRMNGPGENLLVPVPDGGWSGVRSKGTQQPKPEGFVWRGKRRSP